MGPRPPSPCSANKRSHRRKKPAPHKEEQPSLATTGEIPRAATKTQCSQKFRNRLIFKERENKKDLRLWLIGPCGGPPGSRSGSALTLLGCLGAGACGLRICPLPWGQVRAGVWAMGGWGMGGAHRGREWGGLSPSSRSPRHSLAVQRSIKGVKLGPKLGCWCRGPRGQGQNWPPSSLARQLLPPSLPLG